jgi:hypothetical protein
MAVTHLPAIDPRQSGATVAWTTDFFAAQRQNIGRGASDAEPPDTSGWADDSGRGEGSGRVNDIMDGDEICRLSKKRWASFAIAGPPGVFMVFTRLSWSNYSLRQKRRSEPQTF